MFSHMVVGTNDIDRSRKFYDALFASVGGKPGMADDKGRLIYLHGGSVFLVTPPIDGNEATHANGGTIGFAMDGPEQANAWHAAGVAHGGTAIEDPPGVRSNPSAACTWRICAIRTATNCARCTGCRRQADSIPLSGREGEQSALTPPAPAGG